MDSADVVARGRIIQDRVLQLPEWKKASRIGIYLAMPDEVPTSDLIRAAWTNGKSVAAPVIAPDCNAMTFCLFQDFSQLQCGPMNILQPVSGQVIVSRDFDLMIIPGVAFDTKGIRLGFGKGWYDRYLGDCPAFRLGLAFDLQIMDCLPVSGHDIPMQSVLTETRLLP
jgi:5-formyltetrahydrofolate cyclo-ligase